MSMEKRIDIVMVERGLCKSRSRAKSLLKEGIVLKNGKVCSKPSESVSDADEISLAGEDIPYVGRGGLKLEEAIRRFPVQVSGKVCLDVGASTGGFTDCMLQNGAAQVYAVDVGHNQLDPVLLCDKRVISLEGTDIRIMPQEILQTRPGFCCVDVSFISLTMILPSVYRLIDDNAECVVLIKPQFEAGKEHIGKKGIVKSESVHVRVIEELLAFARTVGFSVHGLCPSPIRGGSGNTEYLACLKKGAAAPEPMIIPADIVKQAGLNR